LDKFFIHKWCIASCNDLRAILLSIEVMTSYLMEVFQWMIDVKPFYMLAYIYKLKLS